MRTENEGARLKSLRRKGKKLPAVKERTFFDGEEERNVAPQKPLSEKRAARARKRRAFVVARVAARTGKTKLFVKGKSGVRALGAISKVCLVSDVVVSEDGVGFFVPSKLLPKIVALLDNLCYDYKIIGNYGLAPALVRAATRVGLAIGIVAFAAALAIYPLLITRVNIVGTDGERLDGALNAQVTQILSESGIREGKLLGALDAEAVGKRLLALDGVAYAGVERHGSHVTVLIKKELKSSELFEIEGSTVRATRTATVTRVVVEGGTAAVKYGDVVRSGDVLIEGYTLYGDQKIPVEAKGRVYGTTLLKAEVFFPDIVLKKQYGAVKRIEKIAFFGRTPKTPDSPFERYELKVTKSDFGFLLPMECFAFEFVEIKATEQSENRQDDELVGEVYSSLLAELEEEATIKNIYSEATREERGRTVRVTVEAEVLISG